MEVAFADAVRVVSRPRERLHKGGPAVLRHGRVFIAAGVQGILPIDHGAAGGNADGAGRVRAGERHAPPCQPVEIGRFDDGDWPSAPMVSKRCWSTKMCKMLGRMPHLPYSKICRARRAFSHCNTIARPRAREIAGLTGAQSSFIMKRENILKREKRQKKGRYPWKRESCSMCSAFPCTMGPASALRSFSRDARCAASGATIRRATGSRGN